MAVGGGQLPASSHGHGNPSSDDRPRASVCVMAHDDVRNPERFLFAPPVDFIRCQIHSIEFTHRILRYVDSVMRPVEESARDVERPVGLTANIPNLFGEQMIHLAFQAAVSLRAS